MIRLDLGEVARQAVRDAALPLQVLRAQVLFEVTAGGVKDVEITWAETADTSVDDWVRDRCCSARELLSVAHAAQGFPQHQAELELNVRLVRDGVRMLSLFEASLLQDGVVDHIIGAVDMPYYFAYGPMPVKILDRRAVMIEGPATDTRRSVMVVSRPDVVGAAMRYLQAVRAHAVPARDFRRRVGDLTPRQHAVARLLSAGHKDEEISACLGVSVRTVRQEVAMLLEQLGASTRFAAGTRYARILESHPAPWPLPGRPSV